MALKYPGQNLIGYGEAQVFKQQDVTKGIEREKSRAAAKAKKKVDNTKKLEDLLKDVDYSNVRSADIEYFKNEFNEIIAEANKITAAGGNPLTNLELRKRLNQFNANAMTSSNGKEEYNKNLELATKNSDYQNEYNVSALERENSAPMFGPNASYFATDSQGTYGDADYVAGRSGDRAILNPELKVESWYKTNTENLTLQNITREKDGRYMHMASNGRTQFFETKQEAEDYQLDLVARDILDNHPYPEKFRRDQENAALDANYILEGTADEPDVMRYIKDQIRARTTEVKQDEITDLERSRTNISLSTGQEQEPGSGSYMPTASYNFTGIQRVVDGVGEASDVTYSTVEVEPVYKTVDGKEVLVTPGKQGTSFNFGDDYFNVRPTAGRGFMLLGSNEYTESEDAGIQSGYNTSGEAIDFVPTALVFHNTAKKDFTVNVDGKEIKLVQGEIVDDAVLNAANFDNPDDFYTIEPWLTGKEKASGLTINVGFSDAVHSEFQEFINEKSSTPQTRKENRQVYTEMMNRAGIKPKPYSRK
tara:strand:- start:5073 stop:6677 length:1605 start_codon:yes stop_codon:yes gene_type:complete